MIIIIIIIIISIGIFLTDNQDYERLIACRSVCGQGRYAKLGVFVV